jgi:uncharacterized protein YbjT (DUF2867 family)
MEKVLLAGATGYLGGHILKELIRRGINTTIIVRKANRISIELRDHEQINIVEAEVTRPETISNSCREIDTVISTVGITKQKDGLTYMDVDYQANLNLLHEAVKRGVRKFIYVSVLNGEELKHLSICAAKERFVQKVQGAGIEYCIIRPNGFFSDMSEFYKMAIKGRIYLFGKGALRANPIHGIDLASECVNQINKNRTEVKIGGPETLTQNEIALTAFKAIGKEAKITHIPDWIRKAILKLAKTFMRKTRFGPIEFFMNVMATEMVAPEYGEHRLEDFFKELNVKPSNDPKN